MRGRSRGPARRGGCRRALTSRWSPIHIRSPAIASRRPPSRTPTNAPNSIVRSRNGPGCVSSTSASMSATSAADSGTISAGPSGSGDVSRRTICTMSHPLQRLPVLRPFGHMRAGHGNGIANVDQRLQRVDVGPDRPPAIRSTARIRAGIAAHGGPQREVRVPRGQARPDGIVERAFIIDWKWPPGRAVCKRGRIGIPGLDRRDFRQRLGIEFHLRGGDVLQPAGRATSRR